MPDLAYVATIVCPTCGHRPYYWRAIDSEPDSAWQQLVDRTIPVIGVYECLREHVWVRQGGQ